VSYVSVCVCLCIDGATLWFKWVFVTPPFAMTGTLLVVVMWRLVYPDVMTRAKMMKWALYTVFVGLMSFPIGFISPPQDYADTPPETSLAYKITFTLWIVALLSIHVVIAYPYLWKPKPDRGERKRIIAIYLLYLLTHFLVNWQALCADLVTLI